MSFQEKRPAHNRQQRYWLFFIFQHRFRIMRSKFLKFKKDWNAAENFWTYINESETLQNRAANIRHQCRKKAVLSYQRCLIKTLCWKNEQHLNMDYNFDHQMSLSKSKCFKFLKCAVPLNENAQNSCFTLFELNLSIFAKFHFISSRSRTKSFALHEYHSYLAQNAFCEGWI